MTLPLLPSPVQEISSVLLHKKNVRLFIKREDLIHPTINGNKWRKLKYNIQHMLNEGYRTTITFGGAFSNHIHAIAAASKAYNIPCVCIVRGEPDVENPTINFVKNQGCTIEYVDRESYRLKEKSTVIQAIIKKYSKPFLIPEGGSNAFALEGMKELCEEITDTYDYISVCAGTGFTSAGIIKHTDTEVIVFAALKSDYLIDIIKEKSNKHSFQYFQENVFGGYGKTKVELIQFINAFYAEHHIPLDPIYNGKAMYRLFDLINNDYFTPHTRIVHIHTGGIQGIEAYNYLAQKKNRLLLTQPL